MLFPVILAGGAGSRFWPASRRAWPKQFLRLHGDRSLLQQTYDRLGPLAPVEHTLIVAGRAHADGIRAQLPALPEENLLLEPRARNTAACAGLAAIHALRRDPKAVLAMLPADHLIRNVALFQRLVRAGVERARSGSIVTLGIAPDRPETGFGYIEIDPSRPVVASGMPGFVAHRFAEKPDLATARRYEASGVHLWNAGMFFVSASRLLEAIQRYRPDLGRLLLDVGAQLGTRHADEAVEAAFEAMPSVSLDYAVMEAAALDGAVEVLPANGLGWSDLGHWAALRDLGGADADGNAGMDGHLAIRSTGNTVHSDVTVALVGVDDLMVAVTADAILVCHRDHAQRVREIRDRLDEVGLAHLA